MKVEYVYYNDEATTERLAADLERGQSATLKAYLAAMGRFHRYSLGNVLLITSARPDATQVAGFHTWRKLGRCVRKGEHGIAILAPIRRRRRGLAGSLTQQEDAEEVEERVVGFRIAHVFDISATEGDELPTLATAQGEPGEFRERLRAYAEGRGIALRTADMAAEGLSAGGTIVLRRGLEPAEEFSTLVHEVAHEALHHDGVDRPKAVKETEAEAVAFVVSEAVGLTASAASRDYIQLYDGSRETLMASLERIHRVAVEIIEAVTEGEARGGVAGSRADASPPLVSAPGRKAAA